jgi:quinol monooxygenase YgiN
MENTEKDKVTITTTRVTVRPEKRKEFFQTVTPLIRRIEKEKGCLMYRLYEEAGDENSLILVGEWQTPVNWEDHRKGNNFAVLHGSVTVLSIQTKIDFKLLSQIGGVEKMSGL